MFLNDDELTSLTGRKRSTSRMRVLHALGVEYKRRPDGSLVVLRSHVEKLLDSALATAKLERKKNEPDWSKV